VPRENSKIKKDLTTEKKCVLIKSIKLAGILKARFLYIFYTKNELFFWVIFL